MGVAKQSSEPATVPAMLRNLQVSRQMWQKDTYLHILPFQLSRLGPYHRTEGASWAFRIGGYKGGLLGRGSMRKGTFKVVKVSRERHSQQDTECVKHGGQEGNVANKKQVSGTSRWRRALGQACKGEKERLQIFNQRQLRLEI